MPLIGLLVVNDEIQGKFPLELVFNGNRNKKKKIKQKHY